MWRATAGARTPVLTCGSVLPETGGWPPLLATLEGGKARWPAGPPGRLPPRLCGRRRSRNDGFIPSARPLVGEEERAAVVRVLDSGLLAQGPEVAQFERSSLLTSTLDRPASRSARAPPLCSSRCSPAGSGRATRCRPLVHLRGDGQRGRAHRRTPVFADIEPATSASIPRPSRRRSPRGPPRSSRCTCTATPPTCRPAGGGGRHGAAGRRGRRPGPRGLAARRTGRRVRHVRGVLLYPTKNMTSGEGGMVAWATPRWSGCCGSTEPGHGTPVRERGGRAERPDVRHPRGDRTGAADAGGRVDPAASGQRGPSGRRAQRRHGPERGGGGRARLPPVHRAGARGPGRVRRRARAGARHRRRDLLPGPRAPPGAVPGRHRPAGDRAGRARVPLAAGPPVGHGRGPGADRQRCQRSCRAGG